MKNKIIYSLLLTALIFVFCTCKKPAGEGGSSSIKGSIWVKDYSKTFVLQHEYAGVDIKVYIIYGNNVAAGDKTNTNAAGEFEFRNLRKGSYKVYAISEERIGSSYDVMDVAVSVDAAITKNKSSVDVGTITINK